MTLSGVLDATEQELMCGVHVSGSGPAIVLLHSSLSSAKQWLPLVSVLKASYTCINIDILGYGKAPKITDSEHYNFDVELKRIRQVIENTIEAKPYHLVGHSCGGAIALKLAVEAPEKLLSLSLYEPVAFHLLKQGSVQRELAESFASKVAIKDSYEAATIFTDFWNAPGFFQVLPEKMKSLMAADMEKVNLDFKGLISEQYSLHDLSRVTAKSCIIIGQYSPSLSQQLGSSIAQALPNATELTVSAGHMGPISHAQMIQPKIANFIKQI